MDFTGADIDSVYGIESMTDCRDYCERHPRCLAFTFVKTERACWLKGEGFSKRANPNTISGSINTTLAEVRRRTLNDSSADDGSFAWRGGGVGEEGEESYEGMHAREADGLREDEGEYAGGGEYTDTGAFVPDASEEEVAAYNDSTVSRRRSNWGASTTGGSLPAPL